MADIMHAWFSKDIMIKLSNIFTKIRLPKQDEESYLFYKQLLGYRPKDLTLYQQALSHRSRSKKSNERLEYLGDAVISLVVAQYLFEAYPKAQEGFLTRARAKLVCREHLNSIAKKQGLDKQLAVGSPQKQNSENIYGNAYEALTGAVYIDKGFEMAAQFVRRTLLNNSKSIRLLVEKEADFKSRLLEWGQTNHKTIEFALINDSYDAKLDQHSFLYEVNIDGRQVSQAAGHNKAQAQQAAAHRALLTIIKKK